MNALIAKTIAIFNVAGSGWLSVLLTRSFLPGLRRLRLAVAVYLLFNVNFILILEYPNIPVAYLTLGWFGLVFIGSLMHGLQPFWKKPWQHILFISVSWLVIFGLFWIHLYFGLFQIGIDANQNTIIFSLTQWGRIAMLLALFPLILCMAFWPNWTREVNYYFGRYAGLLKSLIAITLTANFGAIIHLYVLSELNLILTLLAYFLNGFLALALAYFISRLPLPEAKVFVPTNRVPLINYGILIYLGSYFLIAGLILKFFFPGDEVWRAVFPVVSILGIIFLGVYLVLGKRLRQIWIQFVQRFLIVPKYDFREELGKFTRVVSQAKDERACVKAILNVLAEVFQINAVALGLKQSGASKFRLFERANGELMESTISFKKSFGDLLSPFLKSTEESIQPISKLLNVIPEKNSYFGSYKIFFPVQAGDQFIGFLFLGTGSSVDELDYEDKQLLQLFSNAIGIALHRIQLYEDLMVAKQQEAMSRLASYIVHELRNNTSILSLLVQNARKNFHNPAFQKEFLKGVTAVSDEMQALIRKIGAFKEGKIEVQRKSVHLYDLFDQITQELRLSDKFDVRLDIPEKIIAQWDRELIKMSFRNLLMNCKEAMPDGGKIEIQARQKNHHVRIKIRDWGPGMSQTFVQDHLFRPYDTTKPHGLGLGMHQTREIVQAHDGKISVESTPGQGTTVIVELPIDMIEKAQTSKNSTRSTALA